ncbi:MAG: hypothetical protein COS84_11230 [Armatimonadetes bacterium CG07_land_8_20_14_0_80_40_9]|nr:MAG: hypothetical protein COS84_11230 [Armatimonadetes bacterium CG07_land_8_20_14_0_80_40_9]
MAAKTPAYREVGQKQLDDIIQRMIDKRVWDFVKTYWENSPHFPDPVVYENIMYSGHLAQLIGLYEGLSGDYKYSLVCKNISSLSKVTRDGKEYKNYKYKDGVLTIKTSLDKEYDFVVEL